MHLLLGSGLLLAAITGAAALSASPRTPLPALQEEYDPFLAGLDSVDEIMLVLDTAYPRATALEKLDAADALLRRRFMHSYSYLRAEQNWLAASLRPIWDDLASPVLPDDILYHRRAACSQQALVFLEIAKRLGFDHGAVRAPGHFLAGVRIDGAWWVYDANREVRVRRYPLEWLRNGDSRVARIYQPAVAELMLQGARDKQIRLTNINSFAAPKARLFHQVTDAFSHFAWLAILSLWTILWVAQGRRRLVPAVRLVASQPQRRDRAARYSSAQRAINSRVG